MDPPNEVVRIQARDDLSHGGPGSRGQPVQKTRSGFLGGISDGFREMAFLGRISDGFCEVVFLGGISDSFRKVALWAEFQMISVKWLFGKSSLAQSQLGRPSSTDQRGEGR